MTHMAQVNETMDMHSHSSGVLLRTAVIGLTAFLTLVDLFATQAILPSLTRAYGVTPAAMASPSMPAHLAWRSPVSVSRSSAGASTAAGASSSALHYSRSQPRCCRSRRIWPSLRRCASRRASAWASAFTLMLAYLGEQCSAADAGTAFAGYITGNVASNFIGRLISAAVADHFGLAANFYFFAVLNLAGAVMVFFTIARAESMMETEAPARLALRRVGRAPAQSGAARRLRQSGFCILFAFIGTFTYVNFACWCASRSLSAAWSSALFILCSCPPSSRH